MAHRVKKLRDRHFAVLSRALLGESNIEISEALSLTPGHVGDVLRSPVARNELARLRAEIEEHIKTVPLEALRVSRGLLNDEHAPMSVRASTARHL